MEKYIFNDRDPSDPGFSGITLPWDQWDKGYLAELLCRCAKAAKTEGKKYFSIQYYGMYFVYKFLSQYAHDFRMTLYGH